MIRKRLVIGREGLESLIRHTPKATWASQESIWAGIPVYVDEFITSSDRPDEFETPCGIQHRDTFSIQYQLYSYDANDIDFLLYAGIIRHAREHPAFIVDETECFEPFNI